jgi:hypothetical protein
MRTRSLVAVAVSFGLVSPLAGCAIKAPGTSPSASAHPSASSSPSKTATKSKTAILDKLGPSGVGTLSLGLAKAEASATGIVTGVSGTAGTCGQSGDGRLIASQPASAEDLDGKLFFSVNTGKLVMISANSTIVTPEGIHLGSSPAQVKKAYPSWKGDESANQGLGFVTVPGNNRAIYRIYVDGVHVTELSLQSVDQDCAE